MEDNKIEEAAKMYAFNECSKKDIDQYDLDGLLFNAFCSGINWFLGNLWHDASEEPKKDKDLLVERIYHNEKSVATDRANTLYDSWETKVNREEITRWLYIEDLMKGGK